MAVSLYHSSRFYVCMNVCMQQLCVYVLRMEGVCIHLCMYVRMYRMYVCMCVCRINLCGIRDAGARLLT